MSLLLGLPLPSDDPDIHWVLRVPDGFGGVLAGLLAEPGRFPSLSMTLSPKDTVLRRNAVPGVTSMLFVGDPGGLKVASVGFASVLISVGASFIVSLLLRW